MRRADENTWRRSVFACNYEEVTRSYLQFLQKQLPHDIAQQLHADVEPEITLMRGKVTPEDLVSPLLTSRFPEENLYHLADLLAFAVACDAPVLRERADLPDERLYKSIYVASFYLHCVVIGDCDAPHCYYLGLANLIAVCKHLNVETRLQVVRFLASLVPFFPREGIDPETPETGLLVSCATILGGILVAVARSAEAAMREEDFEAAWELDADDYTESDIAIRKAIKEVFAPDGALAKAAERILRFVRE